MPVEFRDRNNQKIEGATLNFVGLSCVGLLFVLALAFLGTYTLISYLVSLIL